MSTALPDRDEVLNAIRAAAQTLWPTAVALGVQEFFRDDGIPSPQALPELARGSPGCGLGAAHSTNIPIDPPVLLER